MRPGFPVGGSLPPARFAYITRDYNCKLTEAYPLIVRGKTWKEKKAFLHQLALDISYAECGGLSWGEEAILGDFFERYGKRFGLLREFRENGIC